MTKKALIISGSPRKLGNSDLLCDSFIKGVREKGNIAEKIYLRDKKIHFCTGCDSCSVNHECVYKDDMAELLEKMVEADVIVLSTSVYFYSMSGLMKNFIDRCVSRYTEISNKDFYFFATAADKDEAIGRTMDSLRGFTDCLNNATIKAELKVGGVWKKGEIVGNHYLEEAYILGLYI